MKPVVTLEIGSTITKANAFELRDGLLHHVGQGFAPTSVSDGDVGVGVQELNQPILHLICGPCSGS